MFRLFTALLAVLAITACTPTTTAPTTQASAFQTPQCFTGDFVFELDIYVPPSYGRITDLTQYALTSRGLENVCDLVGYTQPLQGSAYEIFEGEVQAGNAAICVGARTTRGGHVLSCASQSRTLAAVNAPLGSRQAVVRLSQWSPFP